MKVTNHYFRRESHLVFIETIVWQDDEGNEHKQDLPWSPSKVRHAFQVLSEMMSDGMTEAIGRRIKDGGFDPEEDARRSYGYAIETMRQGAAIK